MKSESEDCNTLDLIVNCLNQQLSEFELLKSMYPEDGEIVLTDKNILNEIHTFLANMSDTIPNHLEFSLYIVENGFKLELCINLPSLYPEEEPDIYLRCNQMNGQQESRMNAELSNYMKQNLLGEVCLYTAILWLQENLEAFCTKDVEGTEKPNVKNDELVFKEDKFVRLWILSHHIYNKKKREEIVKGAKELNLTGFCVPGKPGVICIEGSNSDCQEWWRCIKAMNWKKIVIKQTEIFDLNEQHTQKKFDNFKEILFKNKNSPNSKHTDFSELSKYLTELGLRQNFNDFFSINDT